MKNKRQIILVLSDIHSGYKFGLCNPETELYDGISETPYPIQLGKTQEFLWHIYSKALENITSFAGKDEIIFVFVGDITHGNKHPSEQMSTRQSDQNVIAYYNILPILRNKKVNIARFIIGTAAHNFGEGSSDYLISLMLKEKYPRKDIRALYHGSFNIQDRIIDVAHHGPGPGRFIANKGNSARGYLRDRMMRDLFNNQNPADIYIRGHYHDYVKEFLCVEYNNKLWESYLYICPPMCMPGDWTRQATSSTPNVSVGLFAFEIINGQIGKTEITLQNFDLRHKESF